MDVQGIINFVLTPWFLGIIGAVVALPIIWTVGRKWATHSIAKQVAKFQKILAQQQAQGASTTPTERSKTLGMNMRIANTHEFVSQLIGVQIAGANMLALAVSVASVVGAMISLVVQAYPEFWAVPLWLLAGVVGMGLAILIETITLSSLIRIRLANNSISEIEAECEKAYDDAVMKDQERYHTDRGYRKSIDKYHKDRTRRLTKELRGKRRFSSFFGFLGAFSSAAAGGLFYHVILAGLGDVMSIALGVIFALAVTGNFVMSELHRADQEKAIRESFKGGGLTLTAIKEETTRITMGGILEDAKAYLSSPEAKERIKDAFLDLLDKSLTDITESASAQLQISTSNQEDVSGVIDSEMTKVNEEDKASQNISVSTSKNDGTPPSKEVDKEEKSEPVSSSIKAGNTSDINSDKNEVEEERNTGPMNPVPSLSRQAPQDSVSGYEAVLKDYPKIADWLTDSDRRSVSVKEIMEATNHAKQKITWAIKNRQIIKTPRG
ncbi:MAG: hypothetical protein J2P36_27720, partial [Ktedonobacteraceae bacterium]|nr:hypothetical protein [Ktedonobacteraceae bacterium]